MEKEAYMNCEAHALLTDELSRVKDDIGEIYSLDREREKVMSDVQQKVTELSVKQETMRNDITDLKNGQVNLDTKVTQLDQKVTKIDQNTQSMQNDLKTIKEDLKENKWQPKDYCVVIVAFLSLIGTLATVFWK